MAAKTLSFFASVSTTNAISIHNSHNTTYPKAAATSTVYQLVWHFTRV